MAHGWWHDADSTPLDEGLAVIFAGPASYTGEDVAELHLHGGALSLRRCLDVCYAAGARPAEAGEFTRRAFLNGKLDLTRAEAVADLVGARTEAALDQARLHLGGGLYAVAMAAREQILQLRAQIEVNIDFVDEDVPLIDPSSLAEQAQQIAGSLRTLAGTYRRGQLLREGARVVLVGRPNAGKSSLFNALLDQDRAIVTPIAGTTRDVVDEAVNMRGVPIVLVDTAGLREEGAETVEQAGIVRTGQEAARADLVLHLIAPDDGEEAQVVTDAPVLTVHSKADLGKRQGSLAVSAVTGHGLDALRDAIVAALGGDLAGGATLTIGRERHRVALERAADALLTGASALRDGMPSELAAVDVQEATDALAELVGLTTIEHVLDRLFSGFCIGK